jgi:hypothetical protein
METKKVSPKAELIESPAHLLHDVLLTYEYPEPGNHLAASGSSQIVGDFFEFTDYHTPCSRLVLKYRNFRRSLPEDYYSDLLGF